MVKVEQRGLVFLTKVMGSCEQERSMRNNCGLFLSSLESYG